MDINNSDLFNNIILKTNNKIDDNFIKINYIGKLFESSIRRGVFEVFKTIIDSGFDVNFYLYKHKSPLMISVECGNYEMCEYLVKNGANVNYEVPFNKKFACPIFIAMYNNRYDLVKLLYNYGANVTKEYYYIMNLMVDLDSESVSVLDLIKEREVEELYYILEENSNI